MEQPVAQAGSRARDTDRAARVSKRFRNVSRDALRQIAD